MGKSRRSIHIGFESKGLKVGLKAEGLKADAPNRANLPPTSLLNALGEYLCPIGIESGLKSILRTNSLSKIIHSNNHFGSDALCSYAPTSP